MSNLGVVLAAVLLMALPSYSAAQASCASIVSVGPAGTVTGGVAGQAGVPLRMPPGGVANPRATGPHVYDAGTHIEVRITSRAVLRGIKLEKAQQDSLKPLDKDYLSREEKLTRDAAEARDREARMVSGCDELRRLYLRAFDSLVVELQGLQREYLARVRALLLDSQYAAFDTNREKHEKTQQENIDDARTKMRA